MCEEIKENVMKGEVIKPCLFVLHFTLVTFSQQIYGNNNQKKYINITNLHKKLVISYRFYCENVLKCRVEFGENSEE